MSKRFSQARWNLGRRTFLKLSGAALASASEIVNASERLPGKLSPTPGLNDLGSTEMEYSFTDLFNMPVYANEWGYGQVSKSVSGVTGITFPPYACCGVPEVTWSPGLLTSCELVVNGQLLSIAPPRAITSSTAGFRSASTGNRPSMASAYARAPLCP